MSHSILLVVSKPSTDNYKNVDRWRECLTSPGNLATQNKDIQMLGENVLMLPLDRGLSVFERIHEKLSGLSYKYIIFDKEIYWHEVRAT